MGTITAYSTDSGNITINEADDVTLIEVVAQNGNIEVSAGGDLTALDVRAMTEGNDITLKSAENLYVDYVDAGVLGGADREAVVWSLSMPTTPSRNRQAGWITFGMGIPLP